MNVATNTIQEYKDIVKKLKERHRNQIKLSEVLNSLKL